MVTIGEISRRVGSEGGAYFDRDDHTEITLELGMWLELLSELSPDERDRIAGETDVLGLEMLFCFVYQTELEAALDKGPRWPELALLAIAVMVHAAALSTSANDPTATDARGAVSVGFSESEAVNHFYTSLVNVPLWRVEQLGLDLASFCENVAKRAPSIGARYLQALAQYPYLRYIARPLADRFGDNGFSALNVDGLSVLPGYKRTVRSGTPFNVTFVSRGKDADEGIVLDVRDDKRARISLGGEKGEHRSVVLWWDRWPGQGVPSAEVVVDGAEPAVHLFVSNAWRLPDGSVGEWLGNYGIVIHEADNSVILRCSDGNGPPNFDDLVVRLGFPD